MKQEKKVSEKFKKTEVERMIDKESGKDYIQNSQLLYRRKYSLRAEVTQEMGV